MHPDSRVSHSNAVLSALLTVGLVISALAPSASGQTLRGRGLQSGLHTFGARHTARVAVAEIGAAGADTRVVIELLDAEDRVVARQAGVLRRGQPVQLDYVVTEPLVQLRATVVIRTLSALSRPTTTFEDIDVDAFSIVPKVVCGPPSGRSDPQLFCPGWEVTDFAP